MRVLITGGAGFVGARLANLFLDADPQNEVVCLDNLKRRGAELNLPVFARRGIRFEYGDVRSAADFDGLPGTFDLFVDAAAEPSVQAGLNGSPDYVLQTNLVGTMNGLEFARKRAGAFVFLSTSRVYSIGPLRDIALSEGETRFHISGEQPQPGVSPAGVSERFPTHLPRSLYGASKLASEMLVQEYADTYGLKAVIDRCGVIAGPGQFGKVDQGVFTLWVANHHFGKPLRYTGFGATGKQVRDLLHPADLFGLIEKQVAAIDSCSGEVFNVGGGLRGSTSLLELTSTCRQATWREVPLARDPTTSPVDIPSYVTDHALATERFGWEPTRGVGEIVGEIADWLRAEEPSLRPLFGA